MKIAQLPRLYLRPTVISVLMIVFISNPGAAADGDATLIVSPSSAAPSDEDHDGILIWVELITTEP